MQVKLSPPYNNVREAYQHLLQFTENPNIPKTAPNAYVLLFVRNNFINYRAYESFESIARMMNWSIFQSNVIVSPEHFKTRYRELQVRKMYRMITGQRFDVKSDVDAFTAVWNIFQSGKITPMIALNKGRQGNPYLFDLQKMSETNVKFTKQCQVIMRALIANEKSAYTMSDLKLFANDLHKHGLKTKQPPFKILQYYLPQLFDAGFVEYPRKQYSEEEDDEE